MSEPRIICFMCKWCTSAGADLAGNLRMEYSPDGINIRFMCSSRVDPEHVIWAFRQGADGVLIGGCHPGDCHYQDGNYKTQARVALLNNLLDDFGIDPSRLRLEWISAAEGKRFAEVMDEFSEQLRAKGPLSLAVKEMSQ